MLFYVSFSSEVLQVQPQNQRNHPVAFVDEAAIPRARRRLVTGTNDVVVVKRCDGISEDAQERRCLIGAVSL